MKPSKSEYAPFYETYVSKLTDDTVWIQLHEHTEKFVRFLGKIPKNKWDYSYAEGKWTIRQVLQHIIDTERIMAYRALTIARKDAVNLPGFDENEYAAAAPVSHIEWDDLVSEFSALRIANMLMFSNFTDDMMSEIGNANNNPISVNALAHIIVGHAVHHHQILKERYL